MVMEIHEAATLFPLDDETIPELAEDVRRRGLLESVKTLGGKVLDGRRRLLACEMAGVHPHFEEVITDDPIGYAWSLNGPRRHLSASQKAVAGARMREMYDQEAKERQKRKPANSVQVNLPEQSRGQSRDKVANAVGVSGRTIDFASKVIEQGVPELVAAVEQGKIAVSAAAAIADEDEEAQRASIARREQQPRRRSRRGSEQQQDAAPPLRGVGVHHANEAINHLIRIPKNDPQRRMARKIVQDWITAYL